MEVEGMRLHCARRVGVHTPTPWRQVVRVRVYASVLRNEIVAARACAIWRRRWLYRMSLRTPFRFYNLKKR